MTTTRWITACLLATCCVSAHANAVSTFEVASTGWTGAGGLPATSYMSTGGATGGYFKEVDVAGGQMLAAIHGIGDQSSMLGGTFLFAYNVFGLQSGNHYTANNQFGTVTLFSGSSFVAADLIADIGTDISGSGWRLASRTLSPSLWFGNATLAAVLTNVTAITINLEYDRTVVWPDEIVGLDDVRFTPALRSVVPEPETWLLLAAGMLGVAVGRHRQHTSRFLQSGPFQ